MLLAIVSFIFFFLPPFLNYLNRGRIETYWSDTFKIKSVGFEFDNVNEIPALTRKANEQLFSEPPYTVIRHARTPLNLILVNVGGDPIHDVDVHINSNVKISGSSVGWERFSPKDIFWKNQSFRVYKKTSQSYHYSFYFYPSPNDKAVFFTVTVIGNDIKNYAGFIYMPLVEKQAVIHSNPPRSK
jgi:hypothetical protein